MRRTHRVRSYEDILKGGVKMAVISEELKEIISRPGTLKVVAATDHEGVPHITYKGSLHVENDELVFYDLLQSSQINKNLVDSIWYDKKVAVNILSEDKRSFHIVGVLDKSVTAGRYFQSIYTSLREKKGDVDLNAIWYIKPEEIKEITFAVRKEEEEREYPILRHIDRLAK